MVVPAQAGFPSLSMALQVLVVDDEEIVRQVITRILASNGVTVLAARSAAEGRTVLETQHVDAVLLDIWLGPVSGFEFYAWIEENRPDLATRVAFVSGDLVGDVARRRVTALGRPLVPKPFESAALLAMLSDLAPHD